MGRRTVVFCDQDGQEINPASPNTIRGPAHIRVEFTCTDGEGPAHLEQLDFHGWGCLESYALARTR